MTLTRDAVTGPDPRPTRRHSRRLDLVLVFVLAAGLRVGLVLHSRGGPGGNFGYDAGVYYTAADALLHGRLPYRDFLLLHPPALPLVLTPFAALGAGTDDHTGFIIANTAFELLGAVDAVLVVLVARRAGLIRLAAAGGGCFYALWAGSAGSEISIRLEPLGNALLLTALLLLLRAPTAARSRVRYVLAGVCFGAAALTKIWWIVPLAVVLAVMARTSRRRRPAIFVALGAAGAGGIIGLPFLARAPGAMWRMVVLDQLGRHSVRASPITRIGDLTGNRAGFTALAAAAVALLVVAAWRTPGMRLFVAILLAQLAVLATAPVYLGYYSDYAAPGAALLVAGALHGGRDGMARAGRVVGALCVVAASVTALVDAAGRTNAMVSPFPGRVLAAGVTRQHCVMTDSPMALIELDVLSRTLAAGCPNWVDVSGRTYDVDRPTARYVSRPANEKWQRAITDYLLSGDAEIAIRRGTGLSSATRARLDRRPAIVSSRGYTVRGTAASGARG